MTVEFPSKSSWLQLYEYLVLLKWDLNQESESEIAVFDSLGSLCLGSENGLRWH